MKIVVDTNVLVSGLLSPFGPPAEVVRLVVANRVQLLYDPRILAEYQQVLTRPKFPFAPSRVEALLTQVEADGELVTAPPLAKPLPDPDDEAFLAVAIAGKAHRLITGNLRHFPAAYRQGTSVISPRAFVELYRDAEPSEVS
ncbi:MAG: putative toxin-antitoxin system toxin component, PIN family [Gammaproteobacteria bacterium]|nr:putative toxin-antitoxin system toxin component, PIN family [Gammaproteobacteria bacterium]